MKLASKFLLSVTIVVYLLTLLAISRPNTASAATICGTFTDVFPSDYYYEGAQFLACRQVISGYADGTFRPYNQVTRGQLAKIVVGGFHIAIWTPQTPTFSDVDQNNPFYQWIETANHNGIMVGYNDGTFGWGNPASRGQAVKAIIVASGYTPIYPYNTFADVPYGHPFYQYVEAAYARDILSGYTCGGPYEPCDAQNRPYFRPDINLDPNLPDASLKRGQTVKIVTNARFFHPTGSFPPANVPVSPYPGSNNWDLATSSTPNLRTLPSGNVDGTVTGSSSYRVSARQILWTAAAGSWIINNQNSGNVQAISFTAYWSNGHSTSGLWGAVIAPSWRSVSAIARYTDPSNPNTFNQLQVRILDPYNDIYLQANNPASPVESNWYEYDPPGLPMQINVDNLWVRRNDAWTIDNQDFMGKFCFQVGSSQIKRCDP